MKSSFFSACFLFLCSLPHWFSWGMYFSKVANKLSRLYWLNICIDNSSSKGSSNSSTCNLLSSRTVLIWLAVVTSEVFLFTCLHDLISSLFVLNYSWRYKIQKPRETRKVMLKLQFTLILRNELFISTQSLPFSSKQVISAFSACRPLFSVL